MQSFFTEANFHADKLFDRDENVGFYLTKIQIEFGDGKWTAVSEKRIWGFMLFFFFLPTTPRTHYYKCLFFFQIKIRLDLSDFV